MKKKAAAFLCLWLIFSLLTGGCAGSLKSNSEIASSFSDSSAAHPARASSRPQDDYYDSINESVLNKIQLSSTESEWSYIADLNARSYQNLNQILLSLIQGKKEGSLNSMESRIVNLYETGMDMETRNQIGLGELQPYLDLVENAATIQDYVNALGILASSIGTQSLFIIAPSPDFKDSSQYVYYIQPPDLVLGKEYLENEEFAEIWNAYRNYIAQLFFLSGEQRDGAEQIAKEIFDFQKELAASCLPLEKSDDPSLIYHPYSLESLSGLLNQIDLKQTMKSYGLENIPAFIVTEEKAMQKINAYLVPEWLPLLKNYTKFILLHDMAPYLTGDLRDANADFNRIKAGKQETEPADIQTGRTVQNLLATDFGKLYVDHFFSEESKSQIKTMVLDILNQYKEKIRRLDWMSEQTKAYAQKKLDNMSIKIGYPNQWPGFLDQISLTGPQDGGTLIHNVLEIMRANTAFQKEAASHPLDRGQWLMSPQTVNAYYNPSSNEIVFPAAILQPPFYDPQASQSVNLGGIGTVIAHEISHAFDDNGAKYDENGNLNNWWTEEDYKKFSLLQESIVNYYNNFEVFKGHFVNGSLTLGENIADLNSISCVTEIADQNGLDLSELFERYAMIWASKQNEEISLNRLTIDVHSPNKTRVNAVLSSCDKFYEVYHLMKSDDMYLPPEKRVKIW